MNHKIEVLIPEQQVRERIGELAAAIQTRYQDSRELVMIGLLRGSCIFLADLCRAIGRPVTLDFMTAASYGSAMESSRDVRILKDLDEEIHGKDVVIVEDIIDTGHTLSRVRDILNLRQPRSLAVCTLLDKPSRREAPVPVDWCGFTVPDEFVVGFGIDWAQKYRNLPYIGKVVPLD